MVRKRGRRRNHHPSSLYFLFILDPTYIYRFCHLYNLFASAPKNRKVINLLFLILTIHFGQFFLTRSAKYL